MLQKKESLLVYHFPAPPVYRMSTISRPNQVKSPTISCREADEYDSSYAPNTI